MSFHSVVSGLKYLPGLTLRHGLKCLPGLSTRQNLKCMPGLTGLQIRYMSATQTIGVPPRGSRRPNKHMNDIWVKGRRMKTQKIELQDYEFDRKRYRGEVTPAEMRAKMKKMGIMPSHPWQEKPIYISSTGALIDNYVPPEGDGKASLVSTSGATQLKDVGMGKGKTYSSVRKIRKYEEDFDPRSWVDEAQQIYIDAHSALCEKDEDTLHRLATEKCFPEMMNMAKRKTIHWKFIKSIEPPRVVHARHAEIVTKDNMFGQLTVRFHTQQTLAIYDRFGRLIHGSETVAKDVLEYVVFEKHLSNVYGSWRMHAKIIPDWMPQREPGRLTYVVPKEKPKKETEESEETEKKADVDQAEEVKEEYKDLVKKDEEKPSLFDRFGRMLGRK